MLLLPFLLNPGGALLPRVWSFNLVVAPSPVPFRCRLLEAVF